MSPEVTYILQSLGTVFAFGGAVWLATWGLRRIGPKHQGSIEILARQPLEHRRAIYIVRIGKKILVVGATDGGLTRLASIRPDEFNVEQPSNLPNPSFREVLLKRTTTKKSS